MKRPEASKALKPCIMQHPLSLSTMLKPGGHWERCQTGIWLLRGLNLLGVDGSIPSFPLRSELGTCHAEDRSCSLVLAYTSGR